MVVVVAAAAGRQFVVAAAAGWEKFGPAYMVVDVVAVVEFFSAFAAVAELCCYLKDYY